MQAVGLATLALVALPVLHTATYRKALADGENSLAMKVMGVSGTLFIMEQIQNIMAKFTASSAEALRKEALERIKLAHEDPDGKKPGCVCFVGSSTFTYWTNIKRDMSPVRCVNLAFGGSTTSDVLEHVDAVASFSPSIVVYYCGTNDIARGASANDAANGFFKFADRLRERLPGVGIVYLAVSLTPFQVHLKNEQKVHEANRLINDYMAKSTGMEFVDITKDKNFTENWEWYLNDGLHLNNLGHVKLAETLRPVVQNMYTKISSS